MIDGRFVFRIFEGRDDGFDEVDMEKLGDSFLVGLPLLTQISRLCVFVDLSFIIFLFLFW